MQNIAAHSVHCETSGCFSSRGMAGGFLNCSRSWRRFGEYCGLFAATLEFKTAGLCAIIL
jgi:hypothetical protein